MWLKLSHVLMTSRALHLLGCTRVVREFTSENIKSDLIYLCLYKIPIFHHLSLCHLAFYLYKYQLLKQNTSCILFLSSVITKNVSVTLSPTCFFWPQMLPEGHVQEDAERRVASLAEAKVYIWQCMVPFMQVRRVQKDFFTLIFSAPAPHF